MSRFLGGGKWCRILVAAVGIFIVFATQLSPCRYIAEKFQASEQGKVFRILAVEATISNEYRSISGRLFLSNLVRNFIGENKTDVYYIHLLSAYTYEEILGSFSPELGNSLMGNSTKANVKYECENFLASGDPSEFVIFYYCGHGGTNRLNPNEVIADEELNNWLKSGGLSQSRICVILESCYSGSFVRDGAGSTFSLNKLILCSSESDQPSFLVGGRYSCGFFTGREDWTFVPDQPKRPSGLIGGTLAANDSNRDGWASFTEIFEYAKKTTEEYASIRTNATQTPVMYDGIGIDIPFVRLTPPTVSFTYSPSNPLVNQTVTFNASAYSKYGNIVYQWDFGDDNITTSSDPIITHVYTSANNYTVTLSVTDTRNLTNATEAVINVTGSTTDLNQDGTVNILDFTMVAAAYNTKPGDPKWNISADLDKDGTVNILDVAMVAKDYGKTV